MASSAPALVTDPRSIFAEEVRRDLALSPRQIQSKYLYDALGSSLFETICRLPWYKITRAERELLERRAREIVAALPGRIAFVELGGGNGEKLGILLEEFVRRGRRARRANVHLIDISEAALEQSEQRLSRWEHVSVVGHRATYEEGLREAARRRPEGERWLVLFLGSNIGNFDPPAAQDFLRQIRAALQPGDFLLLGADLVKPAEELALAYDDPLGVTAAFNLNLLVRMNAELGADFDLEGWEHRAIWNAEASRVEMRLVSRRPQTVRIPGADIEVRFRTGEWIWTESSYKFEALGACRMGEASGFRTLTQWIEPEARFALTLFEVTEPER
ncbi:MAG TPA: L-histidine N(alpha)-methyltransferase [Candidatus Eisenbacteria bacterium]|jgi:dimethylhistidine N-methyltransferase|nr:L-histidine N(alpha)-methyltransferase [Candidatus Eisenbacteria bacterium]